MVRSNKNVRLTKDYFGVRCAAPLWIRQGNVTVTMYPQHSIHLDDTPSCKSTRLSRNHSIRNPQMAQMNADIGYKARFDLIKVIHQIVSQISAAIRMDLPSISA